VVRMALFGAMLVGLTPLSISNGWAQNQYRGPNAQKCAVVNCGAGVGVPPSQPSGPSPEELRQRREAGDLDEAAQDADDRGIAAYQKGDYAGAVRNLTEALSYAPDDPDIKHNLERAQQALNRQRAATQPNTDSTVVDAGNVPTGLPKSVEAEIPDTPAGNRVRKGFQAIKDHDWKAARAWFQDALNHEPGNEGIKRLVDLADYMVNRNPGSGPAAPAKMSLDKALIDFNHEYVPVHPEIAKPQLPIQWKPFFQAIFGPVPRVSEVGAPRD
jgi:tetratricopeptide (TPR) repeat protein